MKFENTIICGDCLDVMKDLSDECVDLILADVPYGTTACKWDTIIPLEPMWKQLKRLIKPNGAIVMTASQPFTTTLIASNMKMFKYCWVWEKSRKTGFLNAKKQPLRTTEDVVVFYGKQCTYNPQMKQVKERFVSRSGEYDGYGKHVALSKGNGGVENPFNLIRIKSESTCLHPTQKPVALMEYLIKTYTNEGELVLDFACGSGTTCKAAQNLGRRYIGIDISPEYCKIAEERLRAVDTGVPVKEARAGQQALFE